jgi:hypothetical protein
MHGYNLLLKNDTNKIIKTKGIWCKVQGTPGMSFQSPTSGIKQDVLHSSSNKLGAGVKCLPEKLTRNPELRFLLGVVMQTLTGTCTNSRLQEGKQVFTINHTVWTSIFGTGRK